MLFAAHAASFLDADATRPLICRHATLMLRY